MTVEQMWIFSKKDILSFQINELSEANLYAGEDEELETPFNINNFRRCGK